MLPAAFAHGDNMFYGSTEVVVPEVDQAIMSDMGSESLQNVIAEASVTSMKLMEIANFLNARERHFVWERSEMEKKMQAMGKNYKKMDAELKKVHLSYQEPGVNFDAYKDKHQLQVKLTHTLPNKEA
jgi:DNA-binding protein YbaB